MRLYYSKVQGCLLFECIVGNSTIRRYKGSIILGIGGIPLGGRGERGG